MNSQTQAIAAAVPVSGDENVRAARVPWYCWLVVFGAACVPIGIIWDISWHLTIGRDTFWTPAHMLIYLGGALPGCVCGWLVLKNTFHPNPAEHAATVRLWGFQGPIGAWVVIWGSFAMLVSGPFDNWWHNAYGLDVQIISPPHSLLAAGTYFVAVGALLLVVSWQNRATERNPAIGFLFLCACGTLLTKVNVFNTEYSYPNQQHTALFYKVACATLPFWLIVAARASRLRWAATGTAAVYVAISLATMWLLPLFPAQPKLAPIYNPVTHMVPAPFPLLLIVPALGVDLAMRLVGRERGFWRDTGLALVLGFVFFALLYLVQWPFANFLLSPASRNAFFAGDAMWGYNSGPGDWRHEFWQQQDTLRSFSAVPMIILLGAVSARIALWFGRWLANVKR